jgi:hypothetical protein
MPRTTFTKSFLAVVALTALLGTGCDQWLKVWEEAAQSSSSGGASPGNDAGGPSLGTSGAPASAGTGGATGIEVSCKAVVNANGATCKSCVDATGAIVSEACDSVPSGSGGTSGNDSAACITLSDGGPTSCKDAATWMKYGAEICAEKNLTLTDLKPVTTCAGGNYATVAYVCCGSVSPSDAGTTAPAITCTQTTDANGNACETCTDETGKIVKTDCAGDSSGSGGAAGSGGASGSGGSTGMGACTTVDDGGPTSCKDAATWKQYGVEACSAQNLSLTDLKPVTTCAGGYATVTYVCCD